MGEYLIVVFVRGRTTWSSSGNFKVRFQNEASTKILQDKNNKLGVTDKENVGVSSYIFVHSMECEFNIQNDYKSTL